MRCAAPRHGGGRYAAPPISFAVTPSAARAAQAAELFYRIPAVPAEL